LKKKGRGKDVESFLALCNPKGDGTMNALKRKSLGGTRAQKESQNDNGLSDRRYKGQSKPGLSSPGQGVRERQARKNQGEKRRIAIGKGGVEEKIQKKLRHLELGEEKREKPFSGTHWGKRRIKRGRSVNEEICTPAANKVRKETQPRNPISPVDTERGKGTKGGLVVARN